MAKTPNLLIDIGNKYIKAMLVKPGKTSIEIVKMGKEPLLLPNNADAETIYQRTSEVLPILLQRLSIKEKRAIVTLPGRSAFTRRFTIPVVRGRKLDRIVRYEARQHVPFPLEQVNLDYQVNKSEASLQELEVNLVAVRKEAADAYSKILKKNKIQADIIEAAPLSVYSAYANSSMHDPEEVTAIVSIGASSTDIVIEQKGSMQFMRSAPAAGNLLTGLIAKKLGVDTEEAEKIKHQNASEYADNSDISAEDVANVLEKGFETIVTEIRRSFDFFVSQPDAEPVTRILLTGGTCRMEGVTEFLEDRLGVPVSLFESSTIESLNVPPEMNEDLRFEAPMIGMAIRAGGKGGLSMSFAPQSTKQKLELERRAPMLAVMGILIVVMVAGAIVGLQSMVEKQAQAAERVQMIIQPGQDASQELRQVRETQDEYRNRFEKIGEVADKRGQFTRVLLEVQSLIPQDIWLDDIEVTSARINIEGRALNDEKIADYMEALQNSPFFDNNAVALASQGPVGGAINIGESSQIAFRLRILEYRNPPQEEIIFSKELRRLMSGTTILLNRIERTIPEDPTSPGSLIIGLFADDVQTEQEQVNVLNRIINALESSGDETVETIELRFHDRQLNWIEANGGVRITREDAEKFANRQFTQDDLINQFEAVETTPTVPPTPTPTPDPDQDREEADPAAGMGGGMMGGYGGMMGGYGGMGMGGF